MTLYSELTAYPHHKPLQENNAIAEISLDQGIVKGVAPLPKKSWDNFALDTSDRDGGIYQYEPNRKLALINSPTDLREILLFVVRFCCCVVCD